jgi:predicted N-acyltransferase
MLRHTVQFHWLNSAYADFDAFLASLTQEKRKKIRQERRKVAEAGVTTRRAPRS